MAKRQIKSKKARHQKEREDFIPGTETDEQFEKVLSLLSEWIKAGIVSINVDVEGDVHFELPREMKELLETQVPSGLTHKKVVEIIHSEIPALISVGLAKDSEHRLIHVMPEKLHEKINILIKRSEKTVNALINKNLKERILLREATTAYVVDEVRSIASTYHIESKKGEKIDVPYISVELTLARPHSEQMFAFNPLERTISFTRRDDVRVTLDLHKDDIKDLIQRLQKIEENMCK
jgi:hypothetical protein